MKNFIHLTGVLLLILVSACGGGGGGGTTTTSSASSFSGTAMDGYLYKATVFLDLNGNGTFDTGEPTATTSETGAFTLSATQEQINTYKVVVLAVAGTTIDQDSPNETVTSGFTMMSPPGNHDVVSPLTTQVAAKMSAGLSLADAKTAVQDDLGLTTIDVMKNYVAAKATDANYAKAHNVAASIAEVLKTIDSDSTSSTKLADKLSSLTSKVTTQIKPNIESIKSATSTTNALKVAAIPQSITISSVLISLANAGSLSINAVLNYYDKTTKNISLLADWVVTTVSGGGDATVTKNTNDATLKASSIGVIDLVGKYLGITSNTLRITISCDSGSLWGSPFPACAENPTSIKISGVAAIGAPIANGLVQLTCGNGVVKSTTSDTSGGYAFSDVTACAAPYVVKVSGNVGGTEEIFVSVLPEKIIGEATLNITPISNAIAATLSSTGDPLKLVNDIANEKGRITKETVEQRVTAIKNSLSGAMTAAGVPENFDLLKTPFTANRQSFDKLLDNLKIDVKSSKVTITNAGAFVSDDFKALTTAPTASDSSSASIFISNSTNFATALKALPSDMADSSVADNLQTELNKCFSASATDRGTIASPGVACQGVKISSDYLNDGLSAATSLGYLFTNSAYDKAKVGKPEIIRYLSNTTTDKRALVMLPLMKNGAYPEQIFTVIEKSANTNNDWALRGNQRPFFIDVSGTVFKQTRLLARPSMSIPASTIYLSALQFYVDYSKGQASTKINYIKVTGPNLPTSGIFLRKSSGCDQYFSIWKDATTTPNNCTAMFILSSRAATSTDTDLAAKYFGDANYFTFASEKLSDKDILAIQPDAAYTFEVFGSSTGCSGPCPNYTFYPRLRSRPFTMGDVATLSGEVDTIQWNDVQASTLAALTPTSGATPQTLSSLNVSYIRNLDALPPFKTLVTTKTAANGAFQSDATMLPISPTYVKDSVISVDLPNGSTGWTNPKTTIDHITTGNSLELLSRNRMGTLFDRQWRY